tara:strand:- start:1557 stop:1805 length:249 start_codon:yes stop_codon:yes gene_type:complete
MTYSEKHPSYQKVEKVLRLHLEKYGEPWEKRGPIIQDILNELFLDPVDLRTSAINELSLKQREQLKGYAVDHGIDIIGDEKE